jgi:hypothetical protein
MNSCQLAVNPRKTKDSRSICGYPGRLYLVHGGVGKLALICCRRHARALGRCGLDVREASPLERFAARSERTA